MTPIHAVLLGIIEGCTEFLPISSTAHLILASKLLALEQTEFQTMFEVVIQFGAILAVVVLYARSLLLKYDVWTRVLVAFVPTAVIGFLLRGFVKNYLFGSTNVILWALLAGGVIILLFEQYFREDPSAITGIERMTYTQAVIIGLCQSLALVPGVSRAAATILGGVSLGISRKTAVEFSFLLAVPTVTAASALDLVKSGAASTGPQFTLLLLGMGVSFVTALVIIQWLLSYVTRHSLRLFGIYRILLAGAFFVYLL